MDVRLGAITAVLAVGLALTLAFSVRRGADVFSRMAVQLVGLGYAIPGSGSKGRTQRSTVSANHQTI